MLLKPKDEYIKNKEVEKDILKQKGTTVLKRTMLYDNKKYEIQC